MHVRVPKGAQRYMQGLVATCGRSQASSPLEADFLKARLSFLDFTPGDGRRRVARQACQVPGSESDNSSDCFR